MFKSNKNNALFIFWVKMQNKSELNIVNNTEIKINKYKKMFRNIFFEVINVLNIKEQLELSLVIVDSKTQLELNQKYRNKNYVADVLSFQLETDEQFNIYEFTKIRSLGDVFICYEQAEKQAQKYNHTLERELAFLFVHGFLHVLGYDHIDSKDEKIMFDLQKVVLNNLKIFRKEIKK